MRISARELLIEVATVDKKIEGRVEKTRETAPVAKIPLTKEVAEILKSGAVDKNKQLTLENSVMYNELYLLLVRAGIQ